MKEYILCYLDLNSKNIFTRKKKFHGLMKARKFAKEEVKRMRKDEDINLVLESVEKVDILKSLKKALSGDIEELLNSCVSLKDGLKGNFNKMTNSNCIQIPHIGEVLAEDFLEPLGMSQNALAKAINIPSNRIHGIVNGTKGVTADTDLRLTKYFNMSPGYFLSLENRFKLMRAERKIAEALKKIKPLEIL